MNKRTQKFVFGILSIGVFGVLVITTSLTLAQWGDIEKYYRSMSEEEKQAYCDILVATIKDALTFFHHETGEFPPSLNATTLQSYFYDGEVPRCPFGTPYEYDPETGVVTAHKHIEVSRENYKYLNDDAKQAFCDSNVSTIRNALTTFYVKTATTDDYATFPPSLSASTFQTYFANGQVPECPFGTPYSYNSMTGVIATHDHVK